MLPFLFAFFVLFSGIFAAVGFFVLCRLTVGVFFFSPASDVGMGDPAGADGVRAAVAAPAPYAYAMSGGFGRQEATKKQTRDASRVCILTC